jgi:tRNA nucleotidyltransferase (CCA-adding enzyme)
MMVIDHAAHQRLALPTRFACLVHDLGKATTPPQYLPHHPGHEIRGVDLVRLLCERLRVPTDCRELGIVTAGWHGKVHRALELDADELLGLFEGTDALRRPLRFHGLLEAAAADHHGRQGFADAAYLPAPYLLAGLARLQAIDQGAIAAAEADNAASGASNIAIAIRTAKRKALQQFIDESTQN